MHLDKEAFKPGPMPNFGAICLKFGVGSKCGFRGCSGTKKSRTERFPWQLISCPAPCFMALKILSPPQNLFRVPIENRIMSYRDVRPFATKDALQLLNTARGGAYFIPEGFEPILVAHDVLTDEVRTEIRRSMARMRLPTSLRECRIPSYVVTSRSKCFTEAPESSPKEKNPPRPPNAFILYRKAKQAEIIAHNPGISNNDVSKIVGPMWKEETDEIVEGFRRAAEAIKMEHRRKYPDYRYRPRKQIVKTEAASTPIVARQPSQPGEDQSQLQALTNYPVHMQVHMQAYSEYPIQMQPYSDYSQPQMHLQPHTQALPRKNTGQSAVQMQMQLQASSMPIYDNNAAEMSFTYSH